MQKVKVTETRHILRFTGWKCRAPSARNSERGWGAVCFFILCMFFRVLCNVLRLRREAKLFGDFDAGDVIWSEFLDCLLCLYTYFQISTDIRTSNSWDFHFIKFEITIVEIYISVSSVSLYSITISLRLVICFRVTSPHFENMPDLLKLYGRFMPD